MILWDYRPNTGDEALRIIGGTVYQLLDNGVYTTVRVPSELEDPPNPDFLQVIDEGDPEYINNGEYVRAVGANSVVYTWSAHSTTLEEAQAQKQAEITDRWFKAMNDGVPVTVNGISAIVRYEELDRTRYAQVHDPSSVPDPGLLVRSLTEINGKTRFMIKGAPKIQAVLDQTLAHRVKGDDAWDRATSDNEDATTVAAVEAIDVESYDWPKNELPAP